MDEPSTSKQKVPHETESQTGKTELGSKQSNLEIVSSELELQSCDEKIPTKVKESVNKETSTREVSTTIQQEFKFETETCIQSANPKVDLIGKCKRDFKDVNDTLTINIGLEPITDQQEHIKEQHVVSHECVTVNIEEILTKDQPVQSEHLSLDQESATTSGKSIDKETNNSVTLNLEDGDHAAGDVEKSHKEKQIASSELTLDKIIHLEDDDPNHFKDNIQPPKSHWIYRIDIYAINRLEAKGEDVSSLDEDSRKDFITLVFTILFFMLAVTFIFVCIVYNNDGLRATFLRNRMLLYGLGSGVSIGIHYAMMCSDCTRSFPCNVICLFITVTCFSIIAATVVVVYKAQVVMVAIGATMLVVLICLFLALSGIDFTKFIHLLCILSIALMFGFLGAGLSAVFLGVNIRSIHIVLLIISTLLSTFSIIVELQMILGGKTIELGTGDWALGAYMLYVSIIQLFLQLLRLFGYLLEDN